MTGTPASKPADDFEALMGAIMRLQDVVRSMGPQAKVAEIVLEPTRDGRYEVESAIRAAPSFMQLVGYDYAHKPPADVLCEIMGVKIVAQRKE